LSFARTTSTHTIETWQSRTKKEFSGPHLAVMAELQNLGEGTGLQSEEPIQGKCDQPGCSHSWQPDLRWDRLGFIAEVHLVFSDKQKQAKNDQEQQERKTCLEGAGYTVRIYPANMKPADIAWKILIELHNIRLKLRQKGVLAE
jgi:hypothetical protein